MQYTLAGTAAEGETAAELADRIDARMCRLTDRFLDGDSLFADDQELVDWINGISIDYANQSWEDLP